MPNAMQEREAGYTRTELEAVRNWKAGANCPCFDYQVVPNEDWTALHIQIVAESWKDYNNDPA